ncbi:MAG TPA: tripartite tricarboxylate transporter permease [Candidatus Thalassarchaeaceae archaeon]|nr:tripartite tricarboxylate transporter permease [Candidatus Thalassarchaeaceae archaeon]HJO42342.1 tripartite tricarboxylate transporter permease [Candidatus Thalassarchaeaceae archaeon]
MDPWLLDFAWLIASFIFGIFLGCLTGLIPGFHVNNVALIALSLSPVAVGIGIPLDAVAGIIVACGTVHTFLNYIPSALVGAPDDNMALALLPGHRMLISGQAAQGVAYSARGSQMGMLMSIPLLIVARLLFGDNPGLGLYEASRDQLPWLLLFISVFLILTETTRLPWPEWSQKVTQKLNYPLKKRIEFNIPLGKFSIRRRYDSIDLRLGASSRTAGILVATSYFLLTGFYGWAVFELPARSPVGIPSASLLFPSLAGLFGIANLIDIYVTTSEIPPQENNWEMPPWKPLAVPTFLSAVVSSVMAILPGMTAAQATVVVMSARNLWGKLTDPNYIPADFEHGTQPGFENMPQMMVFEGMEELEAEERELFQEALAEAGASPDLDLVNNNQQRDLEIIAILSSVNTAVTVMVLGFLYMVGRPRSGAALALNMMYPIDIWNAVEPPADFIRLLAITVAAGLFAVPVMIEVGKGMLKVHELVPLRTLVLSVCIFITVLVYISTDWIGVGTLVIGTMIGLMAPRIGIRRSHGMGVILVPIMVYTFARELDAFGFA